MQEKGFQVYAPNSLLAQQAVKVVPKGPVGPFLNPQVDPKVANPYGQNSLLDKPFDSTLRMSLVNGIVTEDNRISFGVRF